MKISIESRKGEAFLFESILALSISIIGLTTAIVNLVKVIVEFKKEQKNNRLYLWLDNGYFLTDLCYRLKRFYLGAYVQYASCCLYYIID